MRCYLNSKNFKKKSCHIILKILVFFHQIIYLSLEDQIIFLNQEMKKSLSEEVEDKLDHILKIGHLL